MRRALLFCAAIAFAIACGDDINEPIPDRTPATVPTVAFATTTTEDGLSISTDKDDYQPGDTVHFTGSGWQAGDVLDIVLTDDPQTHDPLMWTVNVGEDGMFHDSTYVVDEGDLNVTFTLVATDAVTGQTLTVIFTDGNLQLQPNPTPDPFSPNADGVKDATTISWRITGSGNENNVTIRIRQGTAIGGTSVKEFSIGNKSPGDDGTVVWDGKNSATPAVVVSEGEYAIRIFSTAQTETGASGQRLYIALVDNTAPVISSPGVSPTPVNQGVITAVTVTGTATDNPAAGVSANRYMAVSGQYNIDGGAFSNMTVGSGTGPNVKSLSATIPGLTVQGLTAGPHLICMRATDDAGNTSPITITGNPNCATLQVNSANNPPVLAAIGNKTVNEQALLSFTATATDVGTLVFSLANHATGTFPTGAAITAGGAFTWTPSEAQGPGVYRVKVVVTDAGLLTDFEEIQITVSEVNVAPVLAAIGNRLVDEGVALTFAATATDADLPANDLTFSLVGEPLGASINSSSGAFSWTPTEAQGPGTYTFAVKVTDDGIPALSDDESITVTVSEVNAAPVWTPIADKTVDEGDLLSFVVQAADGDIPANTLTYSVHGSLPSGASFNTTTRTFSWTPSEVQGPGTYPVTLRVNDGTVDVDESFSITVNEVNLPPVLAAIGDQTVDEETQLMFTASASDPDLPANTLTFSLIGADLYGASINGSTGVFTWTPSEAQGPGTFTFKVRVTDNGTNPDDLFDEEEITVTVNEVNKAPVLAAIGNKNVNEGSPLTFTATATDADIPANTLTFSLQTSGNPDLATASIGSSTGAFSWTPTDDNPTGTPADNYSLKVVVTDNGVNPPSLADDEQISINVKNLDPAISSLGTSLPASIIIGGTLNLNVSFTDPGSGDTHKAQIDCGLGYTNVNGGSNVTSPFSTSCTFASIGLKTVKVKVTDDDGGYDEESHAITVVYNFSGFFAPVDRPNTMNISKVGQAIPLKWRLTDINGNGITDLTSVSVQAVTFGCTAGSTADLVEEYAAGSSGLQNQGNGYYQFNWKTPPDYLNSCKKIALVFGAGGLGYTETPSAFFTFKK